MCLSAFDISPALDDKGEPIMPELAPITGTVRYIEVFLCLLSMMPDVIIAVH